MSAVYYSCLDKRWVDDNFDLLKATQESSFAMILTILTNQEVLPTFFKTDNISINDHCFIEKLSTIDEIIQNLDDGKLITVITSKNPIYTNKQYIVITRYGKDTETFTVKDPYLYTTKYSKAVKQGLLKYKTSSGSSNLISSNDALVGFDIYLNKTTLESLVDSSQFYSVSNHCVKETSMYTMKVVTNSKVTVRKEPNERSSKVYNTYNDDVVEIFEINDDNYGRTNKGWIELSSLVLLEPVKKKIKEKTTIRKNPENGSQKLGRYDKNTEVYITKAITGWCRTNKGWIPSSVLE